MGRLPPLHRIGRGIRQVAISGPVLKTEVRRRWAIISVPPWAKNGACLPVDYCWKFLTSAAGAVIWCGSKAVCWVTPWTKMNIMCHGRSRSSFTANSRAMISTSGAASCSVRQASGRESGRCGFSRSGGDVFPSHLGGIKGGDATACNPTSHPHPDEKPEPYAGPPCRGEGDGIVFV